MLVVERVSDPRPAGAGRASARSATSSTVRSAASSVGRFAGQVVAWGVILGVLAVLTVAVLVPRLAGATTYTVLTSSMSPGMPPGTLVVVRPRPVSEIGIGDVVTYQLESGRPAVVTHRVVEVGVTAGGEHLLTTRGDANDVPDEEPVREVQVRGVRWYAVPLVGHVNRVLSGSQRATALVVVVAGLLTYAGLMFLGAARDRLRRRRGSEAP